MQPLKIISLILLVLLGLPGVLASEVYINPSGSYVIVDKLNFIQSMFIGADTTQLITSSNSAYSTYGASGWITTPFVNKATINFGDKVTITAKFRAAKAGDYWLEGGTLYWTGLADTNPFGTQLIIDKNTCDPSDVHFVNQKIHIATPGDYTIQFVVQPNGPGEPSPKPKEGYYAFGVAWLPGCTGNGIDSSWTSNPTTGVATKLIKVLSPTGTVTTVPTTTTTAPQVPSATWLDVPAVDSPDDLTPILTTVKFSVIRDGNFVSVKSRLRVDTKGTYLVEGYLGKDGGAGTLEKLKPTNPTSLTAYSLELIVNGNTCDTKKLPGAQYQFVSSKLDLEPGTHDIIFDKVYPLEGAGHYNAGVAWTTSCGVQPEAKNIKITTDPTNEGVYVLGTDVGQKFPLPEGTTCETYTSDSCLAWERCTLTKAPGFTKYLCKSPENVKATDQIVTISPDGKVTAIEGAEIPSSPGTNETPIIICSKLNTNDCKRHIDVCTPEEGTFFGDKCVPKTCDSEITFDISEENVDISFDRKSTSETKFTGLCSGTKYIWQFEKSGFKTYTYKRTFDPGEVDIIDVNMFSEDTSCFIVAPEISQGWFTDVKEEDLICGRYSGCLSAKVPIEFDTGALRAGIAAGTIAKVGFDTTTAIKGAFSKKAQTATLGKLKILSSARTTTGATAIAAATVGGLPIATAVGIGLVAFQAVDALSPDEKFICLDEEQTFADKFADTLSFLGSFAKIAVIVVIIILMLLTLKFVVGLFR